MELFTVKEAAKKLKSSEADVYELIKSGDLNYLKLGRYKIPDFEIERFVRENLGRTFDFGRSKKSNSSTEI